MLVSCTGLFYSHEGSFLCSSRGCHVPVSLDEALAGYEGDMVHVVLRHLPEAPLRPDSWGGGCCRWEPSECPFGHHDHPRKLYADASKGVLSREDQQWKVGPSVLRLDWMVGHHGQFILFSPKPVDAEGLIGMTQSLSDLKQVLESLRTEIE